MLKVIGIISGGLLLIFCAIYGKYLSTSDILAIYRELLGFATILTGILGVYIGLLYPKENFSWKQFEFNSKLLFLFFLATVLLLDSFLVFFLVFFGKNLNLPSELKLIIKQIAAVNGAIIFEGLFYMVLQIMIGTELLKTLLQIRRSSAELRQIWRGKN